MKRLTLALAVGCCTMSARAEDQASHNTLTAKEIADGWILLFDGKATFGWTSPNGSKWTIHNGMLAPQKGKPGYVVTTTRFRNYDIQFEAIISSDGVLEFASHEEVYRDLKEPWEERRSYGIRLPNPGNKPIWWRIEIAVRNGAIVEKRFRTIDRIVGAMNFGVVDKPPAQGQATPGSLSFIGERFVLRSIKLKPADLTSIFNGKDLDGWKEFPGRKSKFSVTEEGWLSLKNGPGDLQTTGEWADFILQADCKTNGKNLNSGIFFRCLPGQYQMGYEAQIHNGFGPEKDYTLEIFDPKTNKLLEKKKEKNTAIDWGTGSIYRRVPARLQAAKDNEWFTMTVAAQGRHLATWVNGIQTADWTDNRPLEENARKGAYLKKGPISIQGHDPTTDLLFRNFRIAELPGR